MVSAEVRRQGALRQLLLGGVSEPSCSNVIAAPLMLYLYLHAAVWCAQCVVGAVCGPYITTTKKRCEWAAVRDDDDINVVYYLYLCIYVYVYM